MAKVAFLTGGSRGIGMRAGNLLHDLDWNIVAPKRKTLDMNSNVSVQDFLWINPNFKPDAMIFCHGEWYTKPFAAQDDLDYIGQYRQRVLHPLKMIREWQHKELSVVMVSSTRGFIGGVVTQPYSLACAAQIAMMQGLAREGIGRYNVVCPGLTDTYMGQEVKASGGCKPDAVGQSPESVAENIVMLIRGGTNGRVIRVVDGMASEARWQW